MTTLKQRHEDGNTTDGLISFAVKIAEVVDYFRDIPAIEGLRMKLHDLVVILLSNSGKNSSLFPKKETALSPRHYPLLESGHPFDLEIEEKTGTCLTSNQYQLYSDGPSVFEKIDRALREDSASPIHINVSSFAPDSTGFRLAELLIEAKRRRPDRDIQVMVDKLGCLLIDAKNTMLRFSVLFPIFIKILITHPKIKISRLIHLLEHQQDIYEADDYEKSAIMALVDEHLTTDLLLTLNPALKQLSDAGILKIHENPLDRIDHSKMYSVGGVLFLGGANVADDHSGGYNPGSGKWGGRPSWKDYMVALSGPAVEITDALFFDSPPGGVGTKGPDLQGKSYPVRILHNDNSEDTDDADGRENPKKKQISFAIQYLISHAKETISIKHAYLMDDNIVDKLIEAAGRNVRIHIVLGKAESRAFRKANGKFLDRLVGVPNISADRLHEVLHSKVLIVDETYAITGSANLTKASLEQHGEIAIMVSGKDHPLLLELQQSCKI